MNCLKNCWRRRAGAGHGLTTPAGRRRSCLVADHAGNAMPRALGRLGVAAAERERHIAWDIGIAGLGRPGGRARRHADPTKLFASGDRLQPAAGLPTSIPEISELTPIPGNVGLSEAARPRAPRDFLALPSNGSKPSLTAGSTPAARRR
jgi:predicted N-formylglutamate amidohydrolase